MNGYRSLLASFGLCLLSSSVAFATTQRTFVASNGNDANACSITAPCRGFAAAVAKTTVGGEVIVLDSAGYGPVVITKSVSIISPPGIYAGVSVFSGNGITINAPGATAALRGLSINGQGGANGILVQQAARVRIENCVVSNMSVQGIYHQANGAEVIVLDTVSRDNGDTGVALVAQDATIVLDHVRSEHNVNAGFYIAPTPGSAKARAEIANSLFAENGGNGLWADSVGGATSFIRVVQSVVSGNQLAGFYATAAAGGARIDVTLTRNSFQSEYPTAGAHLLGILPGRIRASASENNFSNDTALVVESSGALLTANANAGTGTLTCLGADLRSRGNNNMYTNFDAGCSFLTTTGI